MGASGWNYTVKWEGSIEGTFAKVRRDAFESGDFHWPWEDGDVENPKPRSVEEWDSSKYGNNYPGAHSIVDMREIVTGIELDELDLGQVLELTASESVELLGTPTPTQSDWDRIGGVKAGVLNDLVERDSGRFVVLLKDGKPDTVVFWGYSGD